MAILSQLFTPEELAGDLKWHELNAEEREMLRRALGAALRDATTIDKDALRKRVRDMYIILRPYPTP
jgi:hypothetical protein